MQSQPLFHMSDDIIKIFSSFSFFRTKENFPVISLLLIHKKAKQAVPVCVTLFFQSHRTAAAFRRAWGDFY